MRPGTKNSVAAYSRPTKSEEENPMLRRLDLLVWHRWLLLAPLEDLLRQATPGTAVLNRSGKSRRVTRR